MKRADWRRVAELAERVLAAADWQALGDIYFHDDGEELWRGKRSEVVPMGIDLAKQLLERVEVGGTSLWVGAGVAELPVMLAEVELRGRRVLAANLIERECAVLNAALEAAAPAVTLRYEAVDARSLAPDAPCDHLGCISVFTDPERWPQLSGVAYGRIAPVQLDLEQFARERDDGRALAAALFARLSRPGLLTTTAEEVGWFLELAEAAGLPIDAGDELVPTAVVGDPVGFLRFG